MRKEGREGQGRVHIDTHGTSWNEIEFGVLIQSNGAENFSVTTDDRGNAHNNEDKARKMFFLIFFAFYNLFQLFFYLLIGFL